MKRWQCTTCRRRFSTEDGTNMHIGAKHSKKGGEAIPYERPQHDDEESNADLMVEAAINTAVGEPVEDWIRDMMP